MIFHHAMETGFGNTECWDEKVLTKYTQSRFYTHPTHTDYQLSPSVVSKNMKQKISALVWDCALEDIVLTTGKQKLLY